MPPLKGREIDILAAHYILTPSFERCLNICSGLPEELLKSHEFDVDEEQTRAWLQEAVNLVYDEMVRAMFAVLPILQPQDFEARSPNEWVNFCFWPGYRSAILRGSSRLFHVDRSTPPEFRNAGTGLWGNPRDTTRAAPYHDCSHNRWYHYATTRLLANSIPSYRPASVWIWFNSQKPRIGPRPEDLVASFTITTSPINYDSEFDALELPCIPGSNDADSFSWGHAVAEKINSIGVAKERIMFPGRPGESQYDVKYRAALLQLLSLFMHALFRGTLPRWFDQLRESLRASGLAEFHIERALEDPKAMEFDQDKSPFVCWSNVTLQDVLVPPTLDDMRRESPRNSRNASLKSTNIGSATLLSSIALQPEYICVVREYVRRVYATIRVFESAIAQMRIMREYSTTASLVLHHEFNSLLNQRFSQVRRRLHSSDPKHIQERKLAWGTMSAFLDVLKRLGKTRGASKAEMEAARESFLKPLRRLAEQERLLPTLKAMAASVYDSSHVKGHARIPALEETVSVDFDLNQLEHEEYLTCFLLVNEPVNNFCKYEMDGSILAAWTVTLFNLDYAQRLSRHCPSEAQCHLEPLRILR